MVVQQLTLASGCKNCKEKRLKCDERKPKCEQCEKKGVVCKGYEKTLKWRPQEDVFRSGTAPSRPRKGKDRAGWPLGGAFTDTPRIYYIGTSSQAPSELPTLRYLASINQQYLPCLPSLPPFLNILLSSNFHLHAALPRHIKYTFPKSTTFLKDYPNTMQTSPAFSPPTLRQKAASLALHQALSMIATMKMLHLNLREQRSQVSGRTTVLDCPIFYFPAPISMLHLQATSTTSLISR